MLTMNASLVLFKTAKNAIAASVYDAIKATTLKKTRVVKQPVLAILVIPIIHVWIVLKITVLNAIKQTVTGARMKTISKFTSLTIKTVWIHATLITDIIYLWRIIF